MTVVPTKRAIREYEEICQYLIDRWGIVTANNFEKRVVKFTRQIASFPYSGPLDVPSRQIRGSQITRQIRVLYRIRGRKVILLSFFDVRQHPDKKTFRR